MLPAPHPGCVGETSHKTSTCWASIPAKGTLQCVHLHHLCIISQSVDIRCTWSFQANLHIEMFNGFHRRLTGDALGLQQHAHGSVVVFCFFFLRTMKSDSCTQSVKCAAIAVRARPEHVWERRWGFASTRVRRFYWNKIDVLESRCQPCLQQ